MDHFQLRNGELYCEDVPLAEIAAKVGTPTYVYSTATMLRHVDVLRSGLEGLRDPLIAYAVKANPNAAVLATFAKVGLGGDVVSGGEIRRARAAGMPRRNSSSPGSAIVSAAVAVMKAAPSSVTRARLRSLRFEARTSATPISDIPSRLPRSKKRRTRIGCGG